MDVFFSLPPISRTLTACVVATSALGYAGLVPLSPLVFIPSRVFRIPPDLWRPLTAFLITRPELGIILDAYFLYQYASGLETDSPRFGHPADFITYLGFVGSIIVILANFIRSYTLLQPLLLALATTFAQDNPNMQVSVFILQFPAKFLPYALLLMALVMNGTGSVLSQATGLLAAHLFDFLTRIWPEFGGGRNYITTPMFVRRLFGDDGTARTARTRGYGTAISGGGGAAASGAGQPQPQPQPQRAPAAGGFGTGWTSGSSATWGGRGPGRRLGGD